MGCLRYKKFICIILALVSISGASIVHASEYVEWPSDVTIDTEYAMVMEVNSGAILYEKNADVQNYPASITKVMTALLVCENCNMTDTVTFSNDAINNTEGSSIARDYGEQMSVADCLYGMMLESSNECAYALAEFAGGGDFQTFVDMMNEKAAELGCTNTHFSNSNGLHADDHYTSCHDMCLIASAAYKNDKFRNIVGTRYYEIPATNKHSEVTPLNNHHAMFSDYETSDYLYEYTTGGKTGYTSNSNYTLVTYAEKDGLTLVCVVMNCLESNGHYKDTTTLFEFCFDNFTAFYASGNETRIYEQYDEDSAGDAENYLFAKDDSFVTIDEDGVVVLPNGADFSDTSFEITESTVPGSVIGYINYTYNGHNVGNVAIETTDLEDGETGFDAFENIETEDSGSLMQQEEPETFIGKVGMFINMYSHTIIKVVVIVAICVTAFLLWFFLRRYIYVDRYTRAGYKKIKGGKKRKKRR